MIRPIYLAHISLSSEDIVVHASHKVLMEVEPYSALVVGDPQEILGEQHIPHPIHVLNICLLFIKSVIKLTTMPSVRKETFGQRDTNSINQL